MAGKFKFSYKIHNHITALTVIIYLFTMFSYIFYETAYDKTWFQIAYCANVAGVISAIIAFIPQFACFFVAEKISRKKFFEPALGIISVFPFLFTWVIHCDQWYEAQPFTGDSVMLVMLSIAIVAIAFILGLIEDNDYNYDSYRHSHHI